LASGTPVITTCTGHIEEEYADFVFLLKDETPQGLARLIEQVAAMEPQLRAHKGQVAQEYMRTHNTWEAQGQRVVKFMCDEILHLCPNQEVKHG
jgi:glycosyltransferase involved in cell wall biosynthesis